MPEPTSPLLEPHEIQEAIRELQKTVLYLEERIMTLESEISELQAEDDFDDDEEENVEPVS